MAHFLPSSMYGSITEWYEFLDVQCSETCVESTVVRAKQGMVVPLINWRPEPVRRLEVRINPRIDVAKVTLASGGLVQTKRESGRLVCTLDLDVADALILRP